MIEAATATLEPAMARRVRGHLMAQLACLGRHTITGLLTATGQTDRDWSADYRLYSRRKLDLHGLFAPVRQQLCRDAATAIVVALDDTRLRKSGAHIPGARYTRDPLGPPFHTNFVRAQRFLQISLAAVNARDPLHTRMVPVDLVHAPAAGKAPAGATAEELGAHRQKQREQALGQVAAMRLGRLREDLDADGHADCILWPVVDGGYTNATLLRSLPPRTRLTGRIRKDAKLFLPPVEQPATGRPRSYGAQAPTPEQLRTDPAIQWQPVQAFACGREHAFRVKSIAPVLWKKTGPAMPLRLVVIAPLAYRLRKGDPLLYRKPAFLICTDPAADLQQIVQTYIHRWDIETNFRDQKTLLGLGQAQVRDARSVETVPVLSTAAYAMLLSAAIQSAVKDNPFAPKWRAKPPPRPSTASLINRLRYELWADRIRFDDFVEPPATHTKSSKPMPSLCSSLFRAAS